MEISTKMASTNPLSFADTATAFKHQSTKELKNARLLFRSFDYPVLLRWGPALAKIAVATGFKFVIKKTIFAQFCGGKTIEESRKTIEHLAQSNIGTILDYSVEGEETEANFDSTCLEIIKTIEIAASDKRIPFSVFKTTGIIRFELLEKMSKRSLLTDEEREEWERATTRFNNICAKAAENKVRIFVDAEESWIQPAIDKLTEEMMEKYNTNAAIVFNTIQLYRHDRLNYLKNHIANTSCFLGYKLVRGAYIEKERERALELNYADPIQPNKNSSDSDYDEAVKVCIENINRVSVCAGTHNEQSSMALALLLNEKNISHNDQSVWFSQLLGMSDHISFNLAAAGYNVAKYVPYGPVSAVIPYLTRRARENSGVAGQMSRERALIEEEITRRIS
jgi:proline dehydrogenase